MYNFKHVATEIQPKTFQSYSLLYFFVNIIVLPLFIIVRIKADSSIFSGTERS